MNLYNPIYNNRLWYDPVPSKANRISKYKLPSAFYSGDGEYEFYLDIDDADFADGSGYEHEEGSGYWHDTYTDNSRDYPFGVFVYER